VSPPPEDASHYAAALLYEEARERRAQGNITGAMARYRRLLEHPTTTGDPSRRAALLAEIGAMHQEAMEPAAAQEWFHRSLALHREHGTAPPACWLLLRLAQAAVLLGRLAEGEALLRECLVECTAPGGPQPATEAEARSALGALLWDAGREAEGAAELLRALALGVRQPEAAAGAAAARTVLAERRARAGPVRYRRALLAARAGLPPDFTAAALPPADRLLP
jgi:tetratricopeptide (TPR) repeat protein